MSAAPIITFTSLKAKANNTENMKPDENGYYTINLGAVNVFNSAGEYYTAPQEVIDLFTNKSSTLQRRLNAGYLSSEVGHPKKQPGQSMAEYMSRLISIEETNVCAHIKEVWLEETTETTGVGNDKLILIKGKVKPEGPQADFLKAKFENGDANLAFSVRAPVKRVVINGVVHKQIMSIITWDYVTEPGIAQANKWKTIGLESLTLLEVSMEDLEDGGQIEECMNCSLEDSGSVKTEVITLFRNEIKKQTTQTLLKDW